VVQAIGVELGNGDDAYPNGDEVQTAELWKPPPLFESLPSDRLNIVLTKLGAGLGDGQRYSTAPAAKERAAWRAVQEQFPDLKEERCRAVIKAWVDNEMFEVGEYEDPKRRRTVTGILSAKRIGKEEWEEATD
jgi:hypothetical protein